MEHQKSSWIKYILVWLGIFIVGSLIVSFIISPNSFQSFKENVKDITRGLTSKSMETVDTFEVDVPWLISSCSQLEIGAQANQMSESFIKEKTCTNLCGEKEKEFHHFECVTDKLHCYCLE